MMACGKGYRDMYGKRMDGVGELGYSKRVCRFSSLVAAPEEVNQVQQFSPSHDAKYRPAVLQKQDSKLFSVLSHRKLYPAQDPVPTEPQECISRSIKACTKKGFVFTPSTAKLCCVSDGTRKTLQDLRDRNYYVNHKLNAEKEAFAAKKVRDNRTLRNFLNVL